MSRPAHRREAVKSVGKIVIVRVGAELAADAYRATLGREPKTMKDLANFCYGHLVADLEGRCADGEYSGGVDTEDE